MADLDLGHVQVNKETSKRFKRLRVAYVDEDLGRLTNDQFMRQLLNMWEQGLEKMGKK